MIIKQYSITLPADYDMGMIRTRVAMRGPAFDTMPGLGLKCFLIREKGRCGASSNEYAPLYFWPQLQSLWAFVAGPGFRGIVDSFGWTSIRFWPAMTFARATGSDFKQIRSVTREEQTLRAGTDLQALYHAQLADAQQRVSNTAGLLAFAVGLNPENWSMVSFGCWRLPQTELAASAQSYEVLHVSAPAAEALQVTPSVSPSAPDAAR